MILYAYSVVSLNTEFIQIMIYVVFKFTALELYFKYLYVLYF
jgi:hypothetical protein